MTAFIGTSASASYVTDCSEALASKWREQIATHPLDLSKHVIVLSIDSPIRRTQQSQERDYRRAITNLKRAFPSFQESPTSGILLGCCAIPARGSVSPQDFKRLRQARFVPLCEVADRSKSQSASVRAEYRSTYEKNPGGSEAYFFVYWHRKNLR
jgi:hypothetical protein